jgi:hypothetical protein
MLNWRRSTDSGDLSGLTSAELQAVASLWKQSARELTASFDGSSMGPTIKPGTEVVIRCTDIVTVGEVIVYVYLDQVVVHRLIASGRGWLLTRGDAHTVPDTPITDARVLIGSVAGIRHGDVVEPIPPPPRSFSRSVARSVVLISGLFGIIGIRASIRVLRIVSALMRRPRVAW